MGGSARRYRSPSGPFHGFWLFREGERAHAHYDDVLGRRDAPVRIADDILQHVLSRLQAMPTENPARRGEPGHGLNLCGPTVIAAGGGAVLQEVMSTWIARIPESLEYVEFEYLVTLDPVEEQWVRRRLGGFPGDPRADLSADFAGGSSDAESFIEILQLPRAGFVEQIGTLAEFGRLAAAGTHFVLHLGV